MNKYFLVCVFIAHFTNSQASANESASDRIELLLRQVQQLSDEVQNLRMTQVRRDAQYEELLAEVTSLRQTLAEQDLADLPAESNGTTVVDLDIQELDSLDNDGDAHVLSNPWWKNFQLSGFGAAGYYDTGTAGTQPDGSFHIREATIFIEAEAWDDLSFYVEFATNRLGKDDQVFTRTSEVYLHARNLFPRTESPIGMKLGRIDVPFGEEYLFQDAIDNPLITHSAPWPYGFDEGVLLYSKFKGIDWIASITDGTDERSFDDDSSKAVNLKFSGNPTPSLYLSASFMDNGDAGKSAVEFAGSHFEPVMGSDASLVGARLAQVDATYAFGHGNFSGKLWLSYGAAEQNDAGDLFDRDFRWWVVQPYLQLNEHWYTVLRFSEIGTYDRTEGYHFDGKTFAGGNSSFGYDVERFRRFAVGLGWTPNPNLRTKLEIGRDWFDLIDASARTPDNDDRSFIGIEAAVGF